MMSSSRVANKLLETVLHMEHIGRYSMEECDSTFCTPNYKTKYDKCTPQKCTVLIVGLHENIYSIRVSNSWNVNLNTRVIYTFR